MTAQETAELDLAACIDAWIEGALFQIDKWIDEGVGPLELRDNAIFCTAHFAGFLQGRGAITPQQEPAILDKLRSAMNDRLTERLPQHPPTLWQINPGVPTLQ